MIRLYARSPRIILILAALAGLASTPPPPPAPSTQSPPAAQSPPATQLLPSADIDRTLGATGAWDASKHVYKVTFPRSDVAIRVDGSPLPPFMGLTSWVAFQAARGGQTMMMGDLVLFQDEVNPVLDALLGGGAEVTALHNHFFYDDPRVFFMHVGGAGKADDLARAVRAANETVRSVRAKNTVPAATSGRPPLPKSALDGSALGTILGVAGQSKEGMFKAVFGRKVVHADEEVGADMGINTWAAFSGAADDSIVDGDFAMRRDELQGTLKTLRSGGIDIVAIHNHMTGEEPRMIFLHYWGRGAATRLAATVRKALDGLAP